MTETRSTDTSGSRTPYYADETVTVYAGDCLDVMRTLADCSVDAVVTDPPYGLEFMGKEWDRFAGTTADRDFKGFVLAQQRTRNVKCPDCHKWAYDHPGRLCECGGVRRAQGNTFQQWCQLWATECLRVLKPGGHMLAFGGTRTSHRLACAVEDAGFEIRDSIAWLYGSGFPKSLDVSKAIDRARGEDRVPVDAVRSWLNERRIAAGFSHDAVNKHFGHASNGGGSSSAWMTNPTSKSLPTWEQWIELKRIFGFDGEMDAEVWRLNGRKGKPGDNFEARELLSSRQVADIRNGHGREYGGAMFAGEETGKIEHHVTAPATDDARTWQGWGTALKPAWENVVHAQKPLTDKDILARIGSWLAQAVDPTTPTGEAADSSAQTATSPSESVTTTSSNTVTSWRQCWAELSDATNTSTTSITSGTTTDLKTLWSCLSQLTPANITSDPTSPVGLSSFVDAVDAMFAAAVLNSRATRMLTATGNATSATRPTSPAGAALSQVVVARKPLTGTVAANVLRYGTGALNVDGCRVGTTDALSFGSRAIGTASGIYGTQEPKGEGEQNPAGRWPANVVLDESQADALDAMSGETTSGNRKAGTYGLMGYMGADEAPMPAVNGDSGGASRFFYTAKASAEERIRFPKAGAGNDRVLDDRGMATVAQCQTCGTKLPNAACTHDNAVRVRLPPRADAISHPTVKPLSLMRWLVRLVCPPGGTVLEPFAGSGTTVEACILEGFACIAIEREADYLPLIVQRINRRRDPVAAVKATGDDGGLFDLLDPGDVAPCDR